MAQEVRGAHCMVQTVDKKKPKDSSVFFIPSLESRRQAAAVGLTSWKLPDGQVRGAPSEAQPVFAPPMACQSTRSSGGLAAQRAD